MRRLVSGTLGRRISWSLIYAMLLPLLVLATPPKKAHAQLTRLPAVAVLDFGVLPSSRTSAILSRSATDAVVVEMTRTGRYDPTPRTQLVQQLNDLGYTGQLNNNQIQKLGQALSVDYVVSGDVTNIAFRDNPRRAVVTLSVRLTDVVSGELANGAVQTGYSSPSPAGLPADDETLVSQALADAAFNCVKTINDYQLPEATILNTTDTDVTLNRGSRDGITQGQKMTVLRGRERVGEIRVTQVSGGDSIATVTDSGKGIRPEDRARAIFQLPGYNVDDTGEVHSTNPETSDFKPKGNHGRPVLATIFGVAAAILLASLLFTNKSRTAGNGVSGLVARAYAEGSIVTSDTSSARVRLTWNAAPDVPVNNIIEYHIYRDDQIIGVTSNVQTTFTDLPTYSAIGGQQLSFETVVTSGGSTGNGSPGNVIGSTAGGNNGTSGSNGTGGNGSSGNSGSNNSGSNTGSNSTQSSPSNFLQPQTVDITPMAVGVPHRYRVNVIYQQILAQVPQNSGSSGTGANVGSGGNVGGANTGSNTSGGTNNGGSNTGTNNNNGIKYVESNLGATSGQATPIARPATTGPTSVKSLQQVQVSFNMPAGANQYVIEFARDLSYSKKVVKGPFYAASGSTVTSQYLDISSNFADVASQGLIFYRVGARNGNDSPGPMPFDTANADNYIYSANDASFQKPATPPGPP